MATTTILERHSTTDATPAMLSAVKTENRIQRDVKNVCAHVQKRRLFRQRQTIVELGENLHFEECTRPELTQP